MTIEELKAIRERWAKQRKYPLVLTPGGDSGKVLMPQRDLSIMERDAVALLAEIDRLRPKAEAWEEFGTDITKVLQASGAKAGQWYVWQRMVKLTEKGAAEMTEPRAWPSKPDPETLARMEALSPSQAATLRGQRLPFPLAQLGHWNWQAPLHDWATCACHLCVEHRQSRPIPLTAKPKGK